MGIAFSVPLQPAETFQVVGLNSAYWDRAFSSLPPEILEVFLRGKARRVVGDGVVPIMLRHTAPGGIQQAHRPL